MIRLRAPAKLNLYLRVLGKRPDGYHELETLFERVDLADELTFGSHPTEIRLTCTDCDLPCGEENLVMKAARLLQQVSGTRRGAEIHLTKRIPVAAGLGGGSSDAAATLEGLNELWQLGLGQPRLLELAAGLGSDVPFFLYEAPCAIGRGRGEVCEPLDLSRRRRDPLGANGESVEPEPLAQAPTLFHVLVVPAAQLSTKEVYGSAQFNLTAPKPSVRMVEHALRNGSLDELAKGLWNDLEPEANRRCPSISLIQLALRKLGCLASRVSGSGPAVFGLCSHAAHAREVAAQVRRVDPSWRVEVIQTDQPTRT